MEVALRRRLEGVAHVSISQRDQTATVIFAPAARAFSAAVFRSALAEADVEVITFEIDACGVVDETNGQHWITTAERHFLLRGDAPKAGVGCVTGRLNDEVEPYELEVIEGRPGRVR